MLKARESKKGILERAARPTTSSPPAQGGMEVLGAVGGRAALRWAPMMQQRHAAHRQSQHGGIQLHA